MRNCHPTFRESLYIYIYICCEYTPLRFGWWSFPVMGNKGSLDPTAQLKTVFTQKQLLPTRCPEIPTRGRQGYQGIELYMMSILVRNSSIVNTKDFAGYLFLEYFLRLIWMKKFTLTFTLFWFIAFTIRLAILIFVRFSLPFRRRSFQIKSDHCRAGRLGYDLRWHFACPLKTSTGMACQLLFLKLVSFFGCLGMVPQLVPCAWFLPVWFRCYVHIGYHRISYVKIMHLAIGTYKMHLHIE